MCFAAFEVAVQRSARDLLTDKLENVAQAQVTLLSRPLWDVDAEQVARVLAALVRDPDVIGAIVFDDRSEPLASVGGMDGADPVLVTRADITIRRGGVSHALGHLELAMSDYRLVAATRTRRLLAGGLVAALLFTVVASALLAYGRTVGTPMRRLLLAIEGRHGIDPPPPVVWRSTDEFGRVIAAFNEMQQRRALHEAQLREARDQLEARVVERTEALERAVSELASASEAAQSANRAKGAFVANMSHELRTPLNAIVGLTELTLETELSPLQRDYLSKARSASDTLLGLINDILDFSKMEAGRLDFESIPFALDEVLERLSAVVGMRAAAKDLELVYDVAANVPARVVGDPLRLGQVLVNLASNAVKFTERRRRDWFVVGTVCRTAQARSRTCVSTVHDDTGIGMTRRPAQGRHLREPFTQADDSIYAALRRHRPGSRHLQGTGAADERPYRHPQRVRAWYLREFHRALRPRPRLGTATRAAAGASRRTIPGRRRRALGARGVVRLDASARL